MIFNFTLKLYVRQIGGLQHLNLDEILLITKNLSSKFSLFYACFSDLEIGSSFYQSVYLKFRAESVSQLTALHNFFRTEAYDRRGLGTAPTAPAPYMPHISMMYGIMEQNLKKTIMGKIKFISFKNLRIRILSRKIL